jgi:hypothetical protein
MPRVVRHFFYFSQSLARTLFQEVEEHSTHASADIILLIYIFTFCKMCQSHLLAYNIHLLCVECSVTPVNLHMGWTCEHLCCSPSVEGRRRTSAFVDDSEATFLRCRGLRDVRTGSECMDPHFPDLWALAEGQWSALRHDRSTPGERDAGTHRIGSWLDPRASLDDLEKILHPAGTRTPIPRSSSP